MRAVTERAGRARGDRGASMVIVAIVLASLLAFAALAVDTAALVQERRTLQNSADAAVLAVAQDCRTACTLAAARTMAQQYADNNADDGATAVESICGTGTGMTACPDPPANVAGYVRVTTATRRPDGSTRVPFSFARVMDPNWDGQAVHARATAAWGGPSSLRTLPLTISICEWWDFTDHGLNYGPPDQVIPFHGDSHATCAKGPAGSYVNGGWGWLDADPGCQVTTSMSEAPSDPGNSPSRDCRDAFLTWVNKIVYLPVFDVDTGGGRGATYHIAGYAAFVLTGYKFQGNHGVNPPCSNDDTCIKGYFVDGQLTSDPGTIGGGSFGLNRPNVNLVD
jgi:hypothetical protein